MIRTAMLAAVAFPLPHMATAEVCDKEVGYGRLDDFEMACEQFAKSPVGKAWRAEAFSGGKEITVLSKEVRFTSVEGMIPCTACVAHCRVISSDSQDEAGTVLFDSAYVADEYRTDWYKCWMPASFSAVWTKVTQ